MEGSWVSNTVFSEAWGWGVVMGVEAERKMVLQYLLC